MSYRGYPGSNGAPSETALFADALHIFDWLRERTADIVLYGESLGTGIATYVAAERSVRALVLEAPIPPLWTWRPRPTLGYRSAGSCAIRF
jgi:pimeloyl-ACP methyl ester carboxylesterase